MPPRVTQDTQVNTLGKCFIDLCVSSGLRIVNGRHSGDPSGSYTPRCSVIYIEASVIAQSDKYNNGRYSPKTMWRCQLTCTPV